MKKNAAYLVLLITVFGLSCQKKKYPESSSDGSPVFYFRGLVNNSQVNLNAGVGNYYMYSGITEDANNVYNFTANLKTTNCSSGCANSILISINDYTFASSNSATFIDSSLTTDFYPLSLGATSSPAPVKFSSQFYPISNHGIASCYWQFGDGATSAALNPSHTYRRPGNYLVSLTLTDSSNCSNKISNVQRVGLGGVRASLTAVTSPSSPVTFSCNFNSSPSTAYSYTLDFGDNSTTLISSTPTSTAPVSFSVMPHSYAPGSYTARLRVTDYLNAKDSTNILYNISSQNSSCVTNYMLNTNPVTNQKAFSNVSITWTDANGKVYSSANTQQPSTSYFQILSVDDYDNNSDGKKTKKLHVKLNCMLYDVVTPANSITMENAEAVILVAYQ